MLTCIRLIAVVFMAAMLLPGLALADDTPPPPEQRTPTIESLLLFEDARIKVMARFAEQDKGTRKAPLHPGGEALALGSWCDANPLRVVRVVTAEELSRALIQAQPGDQIVLADGVYNGQFVATASGTAEAPITLCGTRAAIIDGQRTKPKEGESGYGLHLRGDHWLLAGFSVRHARKGIVTDGASHNILRGLEVYNIGEEGIHFRSSSSDNLLEQSWIHDVGVYAPEYGEGVYIGSAHSNWERYSEDEPDRSDRNRVIGNIIGPHTTAESIDVKEGSSDGEISANLFFSAGMQVANSWVDVKGNGYKVYNNAGIYPRSSSFKQGVEVNVEKRGWGQHNTIEQNIEYASPWQELQVPFRAVYGSNNVVSIVLPERPMPYTLPELMVRFPDSFNWLVPGTLLLREHLVVAEGAHLTISSADVQELRLLSTPQQFAAITAYRSGITLAGSAQQPLSIRSWNANDNQADTAYDDGRAYVGVYGGRMDVDYVNFADLGFGTGRASGVIWKGSEDVKSYGNVNHSRFERNFFGAYTYEAEGMRWRNNLFDSNVVYGFDPHDYSNNFIVENNIASRNGKHGMIFSRGCSGNVLRNNQVFNNKSFGIMIDDGKVVDDGNPRHVAAVPSNNNLLEQNEVWNNTTGIVIEGGTNNVVRANNVHHNQYGIIFKNAVQDSEIISNLLLENTDFAIYVYNGSSQNRIVANTIQGGQGGVVIKDATDNVVQENTLNQIDGRGIVLSGNVANAQVTGNRVAGRGTRAIDLTAASGLSLNLGRDNDLQEWVRTGKSTNNQSLVDFLRYHPAILLWVLILCVPTLAWLFFRIIPLRFL